MKTPHHQVCNILLPMLKNLTSQILCILGLHLLIISVLIFTRELRTNTLSAIMTNIDNVKMYDHVCVGGTFDGLHAGHKQMLKEATDKCQKKLVVGVTDTNMIQSKILWELIRPLEERMALVRAHLTATAPHIEIDVVPISDMYGPTLTRPELQYLVVSEETVKGGNKINEERQRKNLLPMDIGVVKLVKSNESQVVDPEILVILGETKVSSSALRVAQLGTILRQPDARPNLPPRPYLIGLTGGIASGKSTISKYLETLGVGYINNDALTHRSYQHPDQYVYKKIVETFGKDNILKKDQSIDRAKLGQIVFNDRGKLEQLQSWIWPAVQELTMQEIKRLKQDHDIIVIESPMLVEAKLYERVHQVWMTMVSKQEAIKRLRESRGLSQAEAEARIGKQLENVARLKFANVVFCTAWSEEFTQKQVRKALEQLKAEYLKTNRFNESYFKL